MKALNKNIFLRYPIALVASIVALAKESNSDYDKEAQQVASYFNSLQNDSVVKISGDEQQPSASDGQLQMILEFAHNKLGIISKVAHQQIGNETSVYQVVCSVGIFKMILTSENGQIKSINFLKKEAASVLLAA